MIVWNHSKKSVFIITEHEMDSSGGPAAIKSSICIAPGRGIDLDMLGLKPLKLSEPKQKEPNRVPVKGLRQQAAERLDAMSGRDEGGIVPPREPMSIDRSPPSWWHGYDQRNCEHK